MMAALHFLATIGLAAIGIATLCFVALTAWWVASELRLRQRASNTEPRDVAPADGPIGIRFVAQDDEDARNRLISLVTSTTAGGGR